MKGLYLNAPGAPEAARRIAHDLGVQHLVATASVPEVGEVAVVYDAEEWSDGPILHSEADGVFLAVSGWFEFEGRLQNLEGLAKACGRIDPDDWSGVFAAMDAGAFAILVVASGEARLATDAFGMHPHYTTEQGPLRKLAPAPCFVRGDRAPDPFLQSIADRCNHLFGNLTTYRGVERLEPGALHSSASIEFFARYGPEPQPPQEILARVRRYTQMFESRRRVLPISGGIDSRLFLLGSPYDFGYTFGPPDRGDRPVARQFRDHFRAYDEFALTDLEYPQAARDATLELFDGVCPKPFCELAPVYRRVYERIGSAVLFDGVLGGALQRGLYLTTGGRRGALEKLLPSLTLRNFDARTFLRRKYGALSAEQAEFVTALYQEKEARLDGDEPHRFLLFDLLYGRGSRYALNGGTILSNQFFTTAQPFADGFIFRALFATPALDWLTFRSVERLWKHVPPEIAAPKTYSGWRPAGPPHLSRVTMLVTKGITRTGIRNRSSSYENELAKITWKPS